MGDEHFTVLVEYRPRASATSCICSLVWASRSDRRVQRNDVVSTTGANEPARLAPCRRQRVWIEMLESGGAAVTVEYAIPLAPLRSSHSRLPMPNGFCPSRTPRSKKVLLSACTGRGPGCRCRRRHPIITLPALARSSPAMIFKMSLAAARRPDQLTKRPCGIDKVIGRQRWKTPVVVLERLLTSSTQSFGAEDGCALRAPVARFSPVPGHIAKAMPATIPVLLVHFGRLKFRTPADDGK